MEHEAKYKKKTIVLNFGKEEEYSIDFTNEVSKLNIIAKKKSDILITTYLNSFSLEDIKKNIKFFNNDDYETIDDCLSEIFEKLDKNGKDENETKIIKEDSENIKIKISKFSNRNPFIEFALKIKEKNDKEKYDDFFFAIAEIKKKQDNEIKALKDKINFLENLLNIKANPDYKKGLENFNGTVIEIQSFGPNEVENYFDLNQDYITNKKDALSLISFVFSFKDEKDIPSAVESFKVFKDKYGWKNDIFIRVNNKKAYIEIIHDDELCRVINYIISIIYDTFSSSIQSLVVKTDAIPKNFFQDYDKEKILKFILSTEIEFKKFSSKIQPFASAFGGWLWFVIEKDSFDLWRLLFDICSNPLNGNYKYKISKSIFKDENNEENEVKDIYNLLRKIVYEIIAGFFQLGYYEEYKKINFSELELNLMSAKFKVGFNAKFKIPYFDELVDDIINKRVEKNK